MFTSYRALLRRYLGPQWRRVALLAALLLGGIALQLINPQIIRYFIDTAQTGGPQAALLYAALAFLAFALASRAVTLAADYTAADTAWTATNALRADLTLHALRLDMPFHKRHTPGELIERIDGDTATMANFFSRFAIQVAGNALLVVGILSLLYREDWRIGLTLTAYALVTLAAFGAVQRAAVPRWTAERQAGADLYGFIEERIAGREEIQAAGAEAYTMRRLYELLRAFLQRTRSALLVSHMTTVIGRFLFVVGYGLGLVLGAMLYLRGQATIGTAYLIVTYVGMLASPLEGIRQELQDLQQATAGINRAQELLREQPRVRDTAGLLQGRTLGEAPHQIPRKASRLRRIRTGSGASRDSGRLAPAAFAEDGPAVRQTGGADAIALPAGPLGVVFDAVTFQYEDESRQGETQPQPDSPAPQSFGGSHLPEREREEAAEEEPEEEPGGAALKAVSFEVGPGRVLGLLGRTGSGKTTIGRLLFRLYDPTGGAVRMGGADLRALPLAELRRHVGVVTQDVQLFQATVRDNLTFFDPDIPDGDMERVLREVGLWPWVQSLPDGLNTELAAGGQGLSAGEAQLLAFARVFLADPGLVILDEASSRLDPATEALLELAIDRLLAGRTAIVIAHRLRTVQRADDILILESGCVAEWGERLTLGADPESRFAGLLRTGLEEALQ